MRLHLGRPGQFTELGVAVCRKRRQVVQARMQVRRHIQQHVVAQGMVAFAQGAGLRRAIDDVALGRDMFERVGHPR